MMRKLLMLFTIALAACSTMSCDDIIDDILDRGDEDIEEGTQEKPVDLQKEYPVAKYEKFVKSIRVDRGISDNKYASEILLYLPWYISEFHYDGFGRPVSVERTCYCDYLGLNSIETECQLQYLDDSSANLSEYRFDHGNDKDGIDCIVYEYPEELYSFSPFYCLETMHSDYWDLTLTHDRDGRLKSSKQKWITEDRTDSYALAYQDGYLSGIGHLSYVPETDRLWSTTKHPDVNIDYNMLLLSSDFLRLNFGGRLPMLMRMGGNVGDNLMKTYFEENGSSGGGYYGYFPKEYAGQTLHFTGNYVNHNEDWQGGPVEYVFEDDCVKKMTITLPVVYYAYEYDVVVGTEPLDPNDPDSMYSYDRFENETSEVVTSCNVVYEYSFTYYTKEEL